MFSYTSSEDQYDGPCSHIQDKNSQFCNMGIAKGCFETFSEQVNPSSAFLSEQTFLFFFLLQKADFPPPPSSRHKNNTSHMLLQYKNLLCLKEEKKKHKTLQPVSMQNLSLRGKQRVNFLFQRKGPNVKENVNKKCTVGDGLHGRMCGFNSNRTEALSTVLP